LAAEGIGFVAIVDILEEQVQRVLFSSNSVGMPAHIFLHTNRLKAMSQVSGTDQVFDNVL
jgi:hypothetical protein